MDGWGVGGWSEVVVVRWWCSARAEGFPFSFSSSPPGLAVGRSIALSPAMPPWDRSTLTTGTDQPPQRQAIRPQSKTPNSRSAETVASRSLSGAHAFRILPRATSHGKSPTRCFFRPAKQQDSRRPGPREGRSSRQAPVPRRRTRIQQQREPKDRGVGKQADSSKLFWCGVCVCVCGNKEEVKRGEHWESDKLPSERKTNALPVTIPAARPSPPPPSLPSRPGVCPRAPAHTSSAPVKVSIHHSPIPQRACFPKCSRHQDYRADFACLGRFHPPPSSSQFRPRFLNLAVVLPRDPYRYRPTSWKEELRISPFTGERKTMASGSDNKNSIYTLLLLRVPCSPRR